MNKKLIMITAAVAAAVAAQAEPGFIRAVFSHPSSAYDGDSDIWTATNTTTVLQPDVYSFTTPEYTTYAYAAYAKFPASAVFFIGQYDDHFSVKVDDKMVVARQSSECSAAIGVVCFTREAWHKIEIRCSNNGGAGGANSSYSYGGVWMRFGTSSTWAKISDPGDGSLFRTDAPEGYVPYQDDAPESEFSFSVNSDYESVTVTGTTSDSKIITIPADYCGFPVTAIGASAFQNNTTVQKIVIPESVTSIGSSAFAGCLALTTCNIPSGVTVIPDSCFSGCTKLRRIVLPEGVKSIGSYAFDNCSSLENVAFPIGLETIGYSSFHGCSSLTFVYLPDTVIAMSSWCFKDCDKLEVVRLSAGLRVISSVSFHNCTKISIVSIPDGVVKIDAQAFWGCTSLQEVVVPAGVTSVGDGAFYHVGRVVFLGRPPAGLVGANVSTAVYPKEYGELWAAQFSIAQTGGFVKPNKTVVTIVSAAVRENDPTVLDVVYKVTSTKPTVKVRALAFEDGIRSFANVTRPETFIDGTAANIGDAVAANVEHTLSWKVSSDFHTDLAKMKFEVLAVEDGILPLELTTIPANGTNRAMELSWNLLTEAQVFDALLWLYADGDSGLTLADGVLKNVNTKLVEGTSVVQRSEWRNWDGTGNYYKYFVDALPYIFTKMGFTQLTGDALTYANAMTRFGLAPDGFRQYAYRWIEAQ